jgi:hypothetical protein
MIHLPVHARYATCITGNTPVQSYYLTRCSTFNFLNLNVNQWIIF